ncbi:hypothetical protein V5P93_004015 [Actinokineospora auranticolor]|nr:hypothetical protein [Actinokineospora auranticolor]
MVLGDVVGSIRERGESTDTADPRRPAPLVAAGLLLDRCRQRAGVGSS